MKKDLLHEIFNYAANAAMYKCNILPEEDKDDVYQKAYSLGKANGKMAAYLDIMKYINDLRKEQGEQCAHSPRS